MCGLCESVAAVKRSAEALTAACIDMAGLKYGGEGALSPELHVAFALAVPVPSDMRRDLGLIKSSRRRR